MFRGAGPAMAATIALVTGLATPANAHGLQYTAAASGESRMERSGRILSDVFLTVDDDLFGMARYPLDNPETTGLFLLGVGALVLADVPVTRYYQDNIEPVFEGFALPRIGGSGASFLSTESRYVIAGLAGSYALGVAFNDERSQTAALLGSKAVAYSYLVSHVILKSAIGRNRPVQGLGTFSGDPGDFTTDPLDFGNWHGVALKPSAFGTAMPSFHVTQYFAVARVYAGVYDNYWIPYSLAGLLFVSNIKGHRHWVSDMVAGALIGTAIGEVVLRSYYGRDPDSWTVLPYASKNEFGLYFSRSY